MANQANKHSLSWQGTLIRFGIIYFALQTIPLHLDFYERLFQLKWNTFVIDLLSLLTYTPHFFGPESTFLDWLVIAVVAGIGTGVWITKEKGNQPSIDDDTLYYYLRILVRYRLAAALLVLGFVKVFPSFAPEPSLSHLNTGYGYFSHWKHLYLSLGVAPAYLSFLGLVEVVSALLLLSRKTAFLGVVFIIPFYGNVFLANLAYEGGGHVLSLFLLSLALVLFLYDFKRFVSLIVHLQYTKPTTYQARWRDIKAHRVRLLLKTTFVFVVVVLYGIRSYAIFKEGTLYYPETPGIAGIQGLYDVGLFVQNGDTITYSPNHPYRWKDVVFEKWNTVSIRASGPIETFNDNSIRLHRIDSLRNYEYALVGDRQYYAYHVIADGTALILRNRNPNYTNDVLKLNIERPDGTSIFLRGTDLRGDSLRIRLDRLDKKYLIEEVKKVGRSTLGFKL